MVTAGLTDPHRCCIKLKFFVLVVSELQSFCKCVFEFVPFEALLRGPEGKRWISGFLPDSLSSPGISHPDEKREDPTSGRAAEGSCSEAGRFCPRLLAGRVLVQDLIQNHDRFQPQGKEVFYLVRSSGINRVYATFVRLKQSRVLLCLSV